MTQSSASGSKLNSDPDAKIVAALASGDPAALKNLMARHLPRIKSLAWYMVKDEMKAEDIAQEVFIKAWKHAPNWQSGGAKYSTWLYRVAKNLCYDHLRKKQDIHLDVLPDITDPSIASDEAMIRSDTLMSQKTIISQALTALPARQNLAITLCHFQNKSQKQAADIMEINVRAYESLLARGRQNLRQRLNSHKKSLLKDMGDHS